MNIIGITITLFFILLTTCNCESSKRRTGFKISPNGKIAVQIKDVYNSSYVKYPMEIVEFDDIGHNKYRKICNIPFLEDFSLTFCDSTSIAFFIYGDDHNQYLLNFYYYPECLAETLLSIANQSITFDLDCLIPKDSIIAGNDSTGVRISKILPDNKVETIKHIDAVFFPILSQDNKQLLMSKSSFINEITAEGAPVGGYILIYDIAIDSVLITFSTPTIPYYYQRKTENSPIYYIRSDTINGPKNLYKYNLSDSEDIKLTDYNHPDQVGNFYIMEDSIILLMARSNLEEDIRFEVYHEK